MPSILRIKAIRNILLGCANLDANDRVLILCNASTRSIADAFYNCALEINSQTILMEIPDLGNHGAEPNQEARIAMCKATLVISLCLYSLAHSQARLESAREGGRFLSLPFYTWEMLDDESLRINYSTQTELVNKFADMFTAGDELHITSPLGTDVRLSITGRKGNSCPGVVKNAGDLGSPPDIEANISPIEDKSEGTIIIDGSITMPDLGLLDTPVALEMRAGRVVEFRSDNTSYTNRLNLMMGDIHSPRRVLAEFGVGLNPSAKLTGNMLSDEGAIGCVHFGFGDNHTVGGVNKANFHLDLIMKSATVTLNNRLILNSGVPIL